jgi:hypothetical protein
MFIVISFRFGFQNQEAEQRRAEIQAAIRGVLLSCVPFCRLILTAGLAVCKFTFFSSFFKIVPERSSALTKSSIALAKSYISESGIPVSWHQ